MSLLSYNTSIFALCFLTTALFSMDKEIAQQDTEKPIIIGRCEIPNNSCICYVPQSYHDGLKEQLHIQSHLAIPVIHIRAWVNESNFREDSWVNIASELSSHICSEKFPTLIPVTCFYNIKIGEIISFDMNTCQVQLKCTNILLRNTKKETFLKNWDQAIAQFNTSPMFFTPKNTNKEAVLSELIHAGICNNTQDKTQFNFNEHVNFNEHEIINFGENAFTDIDQRSGKKTFSMEKAFLSLNPQEQSSSASILLLMAIKQNKSTDLLD